MKRWKTIYLALALCLALSGCGSEEQHPEQEEAQAAFAESSASDTAQPEQTPAMRSGVFTGEDGVLTVEENGTCTYETPITFTVDGEEVTDTVTLYGTVTEGSFSFSKAVYAGLDITSLADRAGYDAAQWEEEAAALYEK